MVAAGYDWWKTETPPECEGDAERETEEDTLAAEESALDETVTIRAAFEAYRIELNLADATSHKDAEMAVDGPLVWAWPIRLYFGQCRTDAVLHVGDALIEAPHWPDVWLPQRVVDGMVGALFVEAERSKQRLAQAHEDARSPQAVDAIWSAIDRVAELCDVARRDTVVCTERSAAE